MDLIKTEKEILSEKDILKFISDYERDAVPELNRLWEYYRGRNTEILSRKIDGSRNNPDNKIPVPYGRKIVTTATGYAYRPRYITYKVSDSGKEKVKEPQDSYELSEGEGDNPVQEGEETTYDGKKKTEEEIFLDELQSVYTANNEHIKTSRAGRNTWIFGLSYELLYIDGLNEVDQERKVLTRKAIPRFFTVDPRQLILLYDYSSEPKKKIAIRYYKIDNDLYKVEVYYKNKVELYERYKDKANRGYGQYSDSQEWKLRSTGSKTNYYGEVPVVAYYLGDEREGLIKPIIPLINAYDTLVSDGMNEFDRFAYAYLVMKAFSLTSQAQKKDPSAVARALEFLKRRRVFDNVPKDATIEFLTKEIPHEFISFMCELIREQIHVQSHVPDFTSEKMAGASGIAIMRLLFDFENIVSSSEADFDVGLYERIELISRIFKKAGRVVVDSNSIVISHKRNVPLNTKDFAETAKLMKDTGFSRYLVADVMPDDIVPDVDEELRRQKEEADSMLPDVEEWGGVEIEGELDTIEGGDGFEASSKFQEVEQKNVLLNGQQLTGIAQIIKEVAAGTIAEESAVILISIALPFVEESRVRLLVSSAKGIEEDKKGIIIDKDIE